jgi:multidrug resistance efflux pump
LGYGKAVEPGSVLGKVELDYGQWTGIKNRLVSDLDYILGKPGRKGMLLSIDELEQKRKSKQALIDKGFSSEESLVDIDNDIKQLELKLKEFDRTLSLKKAEYKNEIAMWEKKFHQKIDPRKFPNEAPFVVEDAGYVVSINSNVQLGNKIGANTPIATVSVMDPILVKAQVFEKDVVHLKIGQKAKIRVVSLDNREYPAVLKSISWTPMQQSFDQPSYYEVILEVSNPGQVMKEGFEVQVVFNM